MLCPCCEKTKAKYPLVAKDTGRFACSRDHVFQLIAADEDATGRRFQLQQSPDDACQVGEEFRIPDDVVIGSPDD